MLKSLYIQMYTILEYGQCFLYLNTGGILGTDIVGQLG